MRSFEEVWAELGYQYGEDALENVRLGWELCMREVKTDLELPPGFDKDGNWTEEGSY